ncbi:MAG: adenylate/guanylate cyclase domain-containing protein [Nitrosomonadales bacterium]|nr:adenylate/guanylate cyclase domain-containing protein [Nitrosomonadales bacterium]
MAELSDLPGEAITGEIIDEQEELLHRSLLIFASAFMTFAITLWLAIYWMMGTNFSSNVPLAYQAISVTSLVYYHQTRNFALFRFIQLCLFLFAPFIMQWSMGSSVTSSGAMLWALLAPVGAVVAIGWRESVPWFIAYIVLTVLSGCFDYFLAGGQYSGIPLKTIGVFFALNFAAMSSIIYFLLRYFVLETENMRGKLNRQHKQLLEEQEKSEKLLCNVLPARIAQRLKSKPGLIADGYADVTVMFADLVNFTQLTEQMSPEQMVGLLNTVFSWLDSFSEQYGLEKIKTIGDAYMVAGGLIRDDQNYVSNIADMALEIRDFVASHPDLVKHKLAIHIGIATGPVVAGVIGTKRIIYDLWGDTVNIASRLTDEAAGGHIRVDKATYNRLRKHYQFDLPSITHLKGKGDVATYCLTGKIHGTVQT